MSASTPDSKPPARRSRPGPVEAVAALRRKLALVEHERRQAVYEARRAGGERPTAPLLAPRSPLPSVDELVASGPAGKRARWKVVVVAVGALASLATLGSQLIGVLNR